MFKFIDLFAGVGGIRIPFEELGGKCVFTSEMDRFARKTYQSYFKDGEGHIFNEDITQIDPKGVPDHDVLLAGFPCQPFSIAGVSTKNFLGREHGFDDITSGTLFFNILQILKHKQPSFFLLENVKNLKSHDKGNTWRVISESLEQAGYRITENTINASQVVPQNRERIFIFGVHESIDKDLSSFWQDVQNELGGIVQDERTRLNLSPSEVYPKVKYILEDVVPDLFNVSDNSWEWLQAHHEKHKAKGNGFGYGIVTGDSLYTRAISARYHKDGSEALVSRGGDKNPRRLTPLECSRLQGFPKDFQQMFNRIEKQPVSNTQAYRQFGNSVCVPVIRAIAKTMMKEDNE